MHYSLYVSNNSNICIALQCDRCEVDIMLTVLAANHSNVSSEEIVSKYFPGECTLIFITAPPMRMCIWLCIYTLTYLKCVMQNYYCDVRLDKTNNVSLLIVRWLSLEWESRIHLSGQTLIIFCIKRNLEKEQFGIHQK